MPTLLKFCFNLWCFINMRKKNIPCTFERKKVVWIMYNNGKIARSLPSAKILAQTASWMPFTGRKMTFNEI